MDPIDRAVQVLFQWNSILTVQDDLLQVVYLKSSRKSNSERFRLDWSLKSSLTKGLSCEDHRSRLMSSVDARYLVMIFSKNRKFGHDGADFLSCSLKSRRWIMLIMHKSQIFYYNKSYFIAVSEAVHSLDGRAANVAPLGF